MKQLRRLLEGRRRAFAAIFRRSKGSLALSRWLLAGRRRQIVVIGGHGGEGFDDNSRAMAIFLSADPGYRVFWVTKGKRRRDVARHRGISQVIRGTFRAEFVAAAAHCLYYSHGLSDVTLAPVAKTPWRKIIYLGHGVWGLKRIERRDASQGKKQFDLTICVSAKERALKASVLGCDESSIVPVGLPKHDALFRSRTKSRDKAVVLYAPTWRDWLQHMPSDLATKRHFAALEALAKQKPRYDHYGREIELVYLVHKNIRGLTDIAKRICRDENIKCVLSKDVDVNKLLRDADFLITDYSALLWDFIVRRRGAAVRFTFDRDVYDRLTGSYEQIEGLTKEFSFDDPQKVWEFLTTDRACSLSSELAERAAPYSTGRSCERLALVVDALLRGEVLEDRTPSHAFLDGRSAVQN